MVIDHNVQDIPLRGPESAGQNIPGEQSGSLEGVGSEEFQAGATVKQGHVYAPRVIGIVVNESISELRQRCSAQQHTQNSGILHLGEADYVRHTAAFVRLPHKGLGNGVALGFETPAGPVALSPGGEFAVGLSPALIYPIEEILEVPEHYAKGILSGPGRRNEQQQGTYRQHKSFHSRKLRIFRQ